MLLGVALLCGNPGNATGSDVDKETGLALAEDWELVRANCTPCHSAKLITQQRASRQQWLGMIRWMQRSQNLWEIDTATEDRILTYLATHYPPRETRRRAPLPRHLMPTTSSPSAAQ